MGGVKGEKKIRRVSIKHSIIINNNNTNINRSKKEKGERERERRKKCFERNKFYKGKEERLMIVVRVGKQKEWVKIHIKRI